jgi:hypothetical protein
MFRRPYLTRLMGELQGHVVELYRTARKLHPHDLAFVDELSPGWLTWIENTLPDTHTITARPGSKRWSKGRSLP